MPPTLTSLCTSASLLTPTRLPTLAHGCRGKPDEPTWLKHDEMTARGYAALSQSQAAALLSGATGSIWEAAARRWGEAKAKAAPKLHRRWDAAVKKMLLPRRTALQGESAMCEQGVRQKKGKAGLPVKGPWVPGQPRKDLSAVVALHSTSAGRIGCEKGVDLSPAK